MFAGPFQGASATEDGRSEIEDRREAYQAGIESGLDEDCGFLANSASDVYAAEITGWPAIAGSPSLALGMARAAPIKSQNVLW